MIYSEQLFCAGGVSRYKPHQRLVRKALEADDEILLARAAQGDVDAFGLLYERYVTRIYNYIYYRTGNASDAEDLTARVFYRAMRHIGNYRDRGLPLSAWLYRIAHNLLANWHRDNSRSKEVPLDETLVGKAGGQYPETELLQTEEMESLLRVVRVLPPDRQQLLILKFVENLSNAEIGQIMDRTEGAIKSLYHRTLISLRDEYGVITGEGLELMEVEGNEKSGTAE
jgi:RNA polymerase sigma-70 factor (ECF subfamily)